MENNGHSLLKDSCLTSYLKQPEKFTAFSGLNSGMAKLLLVFQKKAKVMSSISISVTTR